MSVANAVTRYERRLSQRVILTRAATGQPYDLTPHIPNVQGAITFAQQVGQPIAGGSVSLRGMTFSPQIKDVIEIYLGYDGDLAVQFTGFITAPMRQAFPRGWTLQFRDILWIADFPIQQSKGEVVYDPETGDPLTVSYDAIVLDGPGGTPNDVPATEAAVRLLRDWAGVPEFRIQLPTLETASGQPWILGKLSPVAWSGVSPLQAAQQIFDALGYWLFADYAGYIRATPVGGGPADFAWRNFVHGVDILHPGGSVDSNVDDIYNRVHVTGANTLLVPSVTGLGPAANFPVTDSWQVDIDYLPGGKFRDMTYSNQLIEYVNEEESGAASCEAVAKRLIREHSRVPAVVQIRVKGDPRLAVGQTVGLISERLGYSTQRNFFVMAISTSFGGGNWTQDLTLDGGLGDEGYTLLPDPTASFTFRILQETMNGAKEFDVFVEGALTAPGSGAPIATWTWTAPTGNPTSGTGRRWMTRASGNATSIAITLVVTDLSGKISQPYTQTIQLSGPTSQPAPTRKLNFAAGNGWYVTPNGGQLWRKVSGQATIAVPPVGAGGDTAATRTDAEAGLVATGGAAGVALRSTKDLLETAPLTLATLPGPINFIWQHERDPRRIWVAVGNSVRLSMDSGATFDPAKTPPVPEDEPDNTVRWVVESATQENVIDVLAGRYAFTSFDGGTTWITSLIGPTDSIARAYASGHERHWVGFVDVPAGQSPLRSFQGDTVVFPPEANITSVRAITMMVDDPTLVAFDGNGGIWTMNATTGNNVVSWGVMPNIP